MSKSTNQLIALQETLYASSNPTRRWLHTRRRNWIESALKSCAEGRDVNQAIEIGPGSGVYLPLLAQLSDRVIATDIEPGYLEHAGELVGELPNLHCHADDITASNLPAGTFDLVLCTEVVEHIADSPAALAGLCRLLSPDGRLVLSTPQRFSPLELCAKIAFLPGIIAIVRLIYREPIMPTGHINLLTESELKRQLEDACLEILEEYKCGMYVPLVAEGLGQLGLKIERWIESRIRGSWLDWLLWTQCYVVKRSDSCPGRMRCGGGKMQAKDEQVADRIPRFEHF